MEKPLVSIIIPTYNRAHLIGETLDSIIAQTYTNWECIVVDDGSTDNTDEVMAAYCAKDSRFRYYHRPDNHKPGGNGARNYGFLMSKGEYVQWFDSDDLMNRDKLKIKVETILENEVDFVISQTQYFNRTDHVGYKYPYESRDVNFLSYTVGNVSWFTPDIFLQRKIAELISFNEELKAGQEYNYSCKLLLNTNSLYKVDLVLTHRRFHENDTSIGRKRQLDKKHYLETIFDQQWITLNELRTKYKLPEEFERHTLLKCISSYFQHGGIKLPALFYGITLQIFGWKIIYFKLGQFSNKVFGKYYFFYRLIK